MGDEAEDSGAALETIDNERENNKRIAEGYDAIAPIEIYFCWETLIFPISIQENNGVGDEKRGERKGGRNMKKIEGGREGQNLRVPECFLSLPARPLKTEKVHNVVLLLSSISLFTLRF